MPIISHRANFHISLSDSLTEYGCSYPTVFLDGPHDANVDAIIEAWSRNPAFAKDLEYDLKDPNIRNILKQTDPRTWWDYDRERTLAFGHAETLDVVREALEKQRFDVCVDYMASSCCDLTGYDLAS